MGQAAALSGLIGLTGPLGIVLKPPPVTWLGLISANIGYFIYAPFLSADDGRQNRHHRHTRKTAKGLDWSSFKQGDSQSLGGIAEEITELQRVFSSFGARAGATPVSRCV